MINIGQTGIANLPVKSQCSAPKNSAIAATCVCVLEAHNSCRFFTGGQYQDHVAKTVHSKDGREGKGVGGGDHGAGDTSRGWGTGGEGYERGQDRYSNHLAENITQGNGEKLLQSCSATIENDSLLYHLSLLNSTAGRSAIFANCLAPVDARYVLYTCSAGIQVEPMNFEGHSLLTWQDKAQAHHVGGKEGGGGGHRRVGVGWGGRKDTRPTDLIEQGGSPSQEQQRGSRGGMCDLLIWSWQIKAPTNHKGSKDLGRGGGRGKMRNV